MAGSARTSAPLQVRLWWRSAPQVSIAPTCSRPPASIRPRREQAKSWASRFPEPSPRSANMSMRWQIGQTVCALLAGGGYAEFVAVPEGQFMPLPDAVELPHAAALPEVACTVWSNVVMTAGLTAGQVVLFHGGASGIGTHGIQVARALDCRVAVTAGSTQQTRPVQGAWRGDPDQLPRRGFRGAGARGDGRRGRRRDPRHHGRPLPRPQCRRARRRRPGCHHRHAGRRQGRAERGASFSASAPG